MNSKPLSLTYAVGTALLALAITGCGGQTRGSADAEENRAAKPGEGGGTSTAGSAGEAKNYGDTREKTETEGRSPSASPTGLSQDTTSENNVQTSGSGASTGQQSVQSGSRQSGTK